MSLRAWSTRVAPDPQFEAAWKERLARSPHANFSLDPAHLTWEAARGRGALAVLLDEPGRAAAMVLREQRAGLTSGWPWRWQSVVEPRGPEGPAGLEPADADALLAVARRVGEGRRLRLCLPAAALRGQGFPLGGTLVLAIGDDEALLRGMDGDKRRAIKRAQREGYQVAAAAGPDQMRAFQALQAETEARRGGRAAEHAEPVGRPCPDANPAPGEGWREWELPWMWLLVALRDGAVVAGSGFGVAAGGTLDYRTNASSERAKRDGVNVLLAWEALRRGRERGARWMNWGGITRFKRDLGGEPVEVGCVLGGGLAWALPNRFESSLGRMRPRVAAWWQAMTAGPGEKTA